MHLNERSLSDLQIAWAQLLGLSFEHNYLWTLVYLISWFFFDQQDKQETDDDDEDDYHGPPDHPGGGNGGGAAGGGGGPTPTHYTSFGSEAGTARPPSQSAQGGQSRHPGRAVSLGRFSHLTLATLLALAPSALGTSTAVPRDTSNTPGSAAFIYLPCFHPTAFEAYSTPTGLPNQPPPHQQNPASSTTPTTPSS